VTGEERVELREGVPLLERAEERWDNWECGCGERIWQPAGHPFWCSGVRTGDRDVPVARSKTEARAGGIQMHAGGELGLGERRAQGEEVGVVSRVRKTSWGSSTGERSWGMSMISRTQLCLCGGSQPNKDSF
jgi:hypothetical protein